MSQVSVVMTIGEGDELHQHDFSVLDSLERSYSVSRSVLRVGLLPRLEEALARSKHHNDTWLGRRPLYLPNCLVTEDQYEHVVVVLPRGSSWAAVNAGYEFMRHLVDNTALGELEGYETSSTIRDFAHDKIIPLLDIKGEFSRYPFDVKIAFDLMFALKVALTQARIGVRPATIIESIYLVDPNVEYDRLNNRETRQLALVMKSPVLPS